MDVIRRQRARVKCQLNKRHLAVKMAISIFVLLSLAGYLHAADDNGGDGADTPWQINADTINYDQSQGAYVATGNVVVSRQGKTLSADEIHLNRQTQEALAIGNVRMVSGNDILSGRRLQLNLASETGEINDGALFISENHLYLSGDLIRKTGPLTYTADRITITACDGPDPDWTLTGQDLNLTIEGYGSAKHTALWAGKIPLLYSPYLIFPVKSKRQSGLLLPEMGYSERKGGQYLQPLYWAINENSDATLYAHYMSERGARTGIEYRYVLSKNTLGALFVEGFNDNRVDDGLQDNSKQWGYDDDTVLRANDGRYWIRMKHNQDLFGGLTAMLDLDMVSDQDYLHEFKDGYNGYSATQDYFRRTFGRDIDDEIDPTRLNRLNLNNTWHHYAFNTDLRWYDDVIKRGQNLTDNTLQQLPAITLDGAQQPVGDGPLYYDWTSSYIYFYRINGQSGQRLDLYPRLYLPWSLHDSITVAPSAGLRATAWYPSENENRPEADQEQFYRYLYDVKLDANTEFFRLFNLSLAGSDKLKHSLTPQIIYEYIMDADQDDLPEFDESDRIEPENIITYSLTNTLTTRSRNLSSGDQAQFNYHNFLRFKLSQSFDINKHNDDDPEPFSDITAELDITPGRYIQLSVDAGWSVYDDALTTLNSDLALWDLRGDRLTAEYRFQRESIPGADDGIESIGLKAEFKIGDPWRLRGAYEHNLEDDKHIESGFGFSYQSQCWGMDFDYTIEEDDQRYSIMFNLLSIGSAGN